MNFSLNKLIKLYIQREIMSATYTFSGRCYSKSGSTEKYESVYGGSLKWTSYTDVATATDTGVSLTNYENPSESNNGNYKYVFTYDPSVVDGGATVTLYGVSDYASVCKYLFLQFSGENYVNGNPYLILANIKNTTYPYGVEFGTRIIDNEGSYPNTYEYYSITNFTTAAQTQVTKSLNVDSSYFTYTLYITGQSPNVQNSTAYYTHKMSICKILQEDYYLRQEQTFSSSSALRLLIDDLKLNGEYSTIAEVNFEYGAITNSNSELDSLNYKTITYIKTDDESYSHYDWDGNSTITTINRREPFGDYTSQAISFNLPKFLFNDNANIIVCLETTQVTIADSSTVILTTGPTITIKLSNPSVHAHNNGYDNYITCDINITSSSGKFPKNFNLAMIILWAYDSSDANGNLDVYQIAGSDDSSYFIPSVSSSVLYFTSDQKTHSTISSPNYNKKGSCGFHSSQIEAITSGVKIGAITYYTGESFGIENNESFYLTNSMDKYGNVDNIIYNIGPGGDLSQDEDLMDITQLSTNGYFAYEGQIWRITFDIPSSLIY